MRFLGYEQKQPNGFTVVELLLSLVITGILAAVAYPSYNKHIQQGYIKEAKTTIEALAAAEKVWQVRHGGFTTNLNNLNVDTGETAYFNFNITTGANTFIITANINNLGAALGFGFSTTDSILYSYDSFADPQWEWQGNLWDP